MISIWDGQQFYKDPRGRTRLFTAVESGDLAEVTRLLFSVRGTGFACPRGELLAVRDESGMSAIDLAKELGHVEIATLLENEFFRIDYFE